MVDKIDSLRKDIEHRKRVLSATERCIEESKNFTSLMIIFVDQADRIQDDIDRLNKLLNEEIAKGDLELQESDLKAELVQQAKEENKKAKKKKSKKEKVVKKNREKTNAQFKKKRI